MDEYYNITYINNIKLLIDKKPVIIICYIKLFINIFLYTIVSKNLKQGFIGKS